ncbi:PDGLE domain-containing protein [Nakamurella flava]|uniref:PDGLE domain-containing protein n=1 Tax=Nakamurella flava TaxID=2576308 RepID=UPI00197C46B1|nr:PDGLE domain-containing protein [Nakamurella flava]
MSRRSGVGLFVGLGLAVALLLALVVSHWASSEPDGLERVALDQGFAGHAADSAAAGSPLADYTTAGVDSPWLSTGLSGVIGVLLCFALAAGLTALLRRSRRRRATGTGRS